MKRTPYEVSGLKLEEWINERIFMWDVEEKKGDTSIELCEGNIRAFQSVLHHLTKMEGFPD